MSHNSEPSSQVVTEPTSHFFNQLLHFSYNFRDSEEGPPEQVELPDLIDDLSVLSDKDYLERINNQAQQDLQEPEQALTLQLERWEAEVKQQRPEIKVAVWLTDSSSDSASKTDWNIAYSQQVAQMVDQRNELECMSLNWESESENFSNCQESTSSFEWIDL